MAPRPTLNACRTCGATTTHTYCPAHQPPTPPRPHHTGTSTYRRLRTTILNRDHHTCAYCGQPATEVDHITPIRLGGTSTPDNLTAACRTCNRRKGGGRPITPTPPIHG